MSQVLDRYHILLAANNEYSGFESKIFTITVGAEPQQRVFTAHQAYLSQSPMFERMCQANFRESQSLQISLPDDDPQVIGAIIHYMYCGNLWELECEEMQGAEIRNETDDEESGHDKSPEAVDEDAAVVGVLADLYITAERLQMKDLQFLIVEKLASVTNFYTHPISFLSTAQKIYGGIPDSDVTYRVFYRNTAVDLLHHVKQKDMDGPLREAFDDCISSGGILAADTVAALTRDFEVQLAAAEAQGRAQVLSKENTLQEQVEMTERQTRNLTAANALARSKQEEVYQLRVNHKKQHPSCYFCV